MTPGPIILFGSGETSASGQKVFDRVLRQLPPAPRVALLETPAGFELNSPQVIGRVAEFLQVRLQNYHPQVAVIPARSRATAFSPDDPAIAAPILQSDLIFMGPGSPTYAVRQLQGSLAWHYLVARHRLGAAVVLASAAAISISAYALPVYEIYKVGEDLHWKPGLDFFAPFGLPLVFIPHWNNTDGGDELDTSRCFMGQARFARLMEMLPPDLTVFGLDEKTALILDMQAGEARVVGAGGVTLIHTGHEHRENDIDLTGTGLAEVAEQRHGHIHHYKNGETFPLSVCCPFRQPLAGEDLPPEVWRRALELAQPAEPGPADAPPPEVLALLEQRLAARQRRDWPACDVLRDQMAALGWKVVDTKDGQKLER